VNGGYEKWWGGDAEYDLAQDLEDYYELTEGYSAVLWTPLDLPNGSHNVPTDSLKDRPETYATCGYTSDFEGWGQEKVAEAVRNGCDSAESVFKYITNEEF